MMVYGWEELLALGLAIACQAVVWLQYHKRKVPLGNAGPIMALLFFVVGARAAGVAWGLFERSAREADLSELVFHIIALCRRRSTPTGLVRLHGRFRK